MTQNLYFGKHNHPWANLLLIGLPLFIFILLLALVMQQTTQSWDIAVMQSIHTWTTPFLTRLMVLITDTGGVGRVVPLLLVALWLLWRGYQLEVWTLLGAVSIGQLFTYFFKWLVDRPRPLAFETLQALPPTPAFPAATPLAPRFCLACWASGCGKTAVAAGPWACLPGLFWWGLAAFIWACTTQRMCWHLLRWALPG